MTEVEKPKCACRWKCGYLVSKPGAYVAGHSPNARVPARLCECGCGMPTAGQLNPYYGDHRPVKPRMVAARRKSMAWLVPDEVPSGPVRLGAPAPAVAQAESSAPGLVVEQTLVIEQGPTLLDQMRAVIERRGGGGRGGMRV